MSTSAKTLRRVAVGIAALGAAAFGGLASAEASPAIPRTSDSAYGPCYYNPIPCGGAPGHANPYAKPPLPNSKPLPNHWSGMAPR